MSYNDRFVIVCCDRFIIVKNSVLKLRGEFIEHLADVRLIAIKRKKRLNAVPRERLVIRSMARDRPSPYGEGEAVRFAKKPSRYRSAGACPPRALDCADDIETRRSLLAGGMETRRAERVMKHPTVR